MTLEQVTDAILDQNREIAALNERTKSAHRRIDENDRMIEGVHKLAANVEALALQVKLLTDRLDTTIARIESDTKSRDERIESSLKSQGERIGAVENTCQTILRNENNIASVVAKVDALEKEPGKKWQTLVGQIASLLTAGIVGGIITRIGGLL